MPAPFPPLRVSYGDPTKPTTATLSLTFATVVAAERHFAGGIQEIGKRLEVQLWLSWHHLKYSGNHPDIGSFDEWMNTVIELRDPETEEENPPKPPDAPPPPGRPTPKPPPA